MRGREANVRQQQHEIDIIEQDADNIHDNIHVPNEQGNVTAAHPSMTQSR